MIRHLASAAAVLALGLATVDTGPADAATRPSPPPLQYTGSPTCEANIRVYEDGSWGGGPLVSRFPNGTARVESWNWATPRNMRRFGFPPYSLITGVKCSIRLQ
jgi:hypothetical protein